MIIPMKGQYEQAYNAESLRQLGVPVISKALSKKQVYLQLEKWVRSDHIVELKLHPDKTPRNCRQDSYQSYYCHRVI